MHVEAPWRTLLVGYPRFRYGRRTYYSPPEDWDEEAQGGPPAVLPCLRQNPRTEASLKNPQFSEVSWLPWFDWAEFSAKDKKEQKFSQAWFLYRCWQYIFDPEGQEGRNQFDMEDDPRWPAWSKIALRVRHRKERGVRRGVIDDQGIFHVEDDDEELEDEGFEEGQAPETPGSTPAQFSVPTWAASQRGGRRGGRGNRGGGAGIGRGRGTGNGRGRGGGSGAGSRRTRSPGSQSEEPPSRRRRMETDPASHDRLDESSNGQLFVSESPGQSLGARMQNIYRRDHQNLGTPAIPIDVDDFDMHRQQPDQQTRGGASHDEDDNDAELQRALRDSMTEPPEEPDWVDPSNLQGSIVNEEDAIQQAMRLSVAPESRSASQAPMSNAASNGSMSRGASRASAERQDQPPSVEPDGDAENDNDTWANSFGQRLVHRGSQMPNYRAPYAETASNNSQDQAHPSNDLSSDSWPDPMSDAGDGD